MQSSAGRRVGGSPLTFIDTSGNTQFEGTSLQTFEQRKWGHQCTRTDFSSCLLVALSYIQLVPVTPPCLLSRQQHFPCACIAWFPFCSSYRVEANSRKWNHFHLAFVGWIYCQHVCCRATDGKGKLRKLQDFQIRLRPWPFCGDHLSEREVCYLGSAEPLSPYCRLQIYLTWKRSYWRVTWKGQYTFCEVLTLSIFVWTIDQTGMKLDKELFCATAWGVRSKTSICIYGL